MPDYTSLGISFPLPSDEIKRAALEAKLADDIKQTAVTANHAILTEGARAEKAAKDDAAAKIAGFQSALPWRGRMPNGTDVNNLTTPGIWVIHSQAAADSMLNLAEKYPSLFLVEGDPAGSTIVFSQTQRPYSSPLRKYERMTYGSGPRWLAWEKTWPLPAPPTPQPATSAEAGLANKAWLDAFVQGRGGRVGTGGLAAVSVRVDHGAVNYRDKMLPKVRARNIPVSMALNPGATRLALPENAGVTWADYNTWALNDGMEFPNHGMDHIDATTPAAMKVQLVDSKAELLSKLPNCVPEVFVVPGVSGTDMNGWTATSTPEHFYNYEAGRLVLANHALSTGYVPGKLRPLTGFPVNGAGHYSIDSITSAATVIAAIKDAQAMGAGLQLMLHPSQIDLAGKITTQIVHEILDYLADERDAGRLMLLSMGGLLLADAGSSYRNNLLANPNFNTLTGWTAQGAWTTNGTFARSTSTDAGMLTQRILLSDRKWAVGRVRELVAQFRSTGGAVARISVTNTTTGLSVSKDIPVPAGNAWVTASEFFTVPATASSIDVSVGRVSGEALDIQKPGVLAA